MLSFGRHFKRRNRKDAKENVGRRPVMPLVSNVTRRQAEGVTYECDILENRIQSLGLLSHPCALHMAKAVGFRNIAVHEYASIDWDIVFAIVTRHLGDFRKFTAEILAI